MSELVTDAIRYGTGTLRLRLILQDDLIIEVARRKQHLPSRLRRARGYGEGGRGLGLLLVARLSRVWGNPAADTGQVVWAEEPPSTPRFA